MRHVTLVGLVAFLAALGCGSNTTPPTLSQEQESQQVSQQKQADDAENAFQKESGGIQSKPKKLAK